MLHDHFLALHLPPGGFSDPRLCLRSVASPHGTAIEARLLPARLGEPAIFLTSITAGVTLVTRGAAVHIPIYIRVIEVRGVVAAMFVAIRACELRIVSRNQVTRRALPVGIAMTGWEPRVVAVGERPAGPVARAHAVARPALCNREERGIRTRRMGRACGPVIVTLMAGAARVAG